MKRILAVVLFFILGSSAFAQSTQRTFNLTAALPIGPAATPWIAERGTGINSHTIVWTTLGTVTTCSVKVQKSEDGASWSDLIAGATCTSSSATASFTTDNANYVRVNATTLTGSGTLIVTYFGLTPGTSLGSISGSVNPTTAASWGLVVEDAPETAGGLLQAAGAVVRTACGAGSSATDGDNATINVDTVGLLCTAGQNYVLSVIPGTGATNLGKAIDTATGATDTGVLSLATRTDTLSTLTPANGDNAQLRVSSTGALWTTSAIIDAAEGAAVASSPVPMGCVYRTTFTALDVGDVGYPICDVGSHLVVMEAPTTLGGLSNYNVIPGASDNHVNIKNGVGQVYSVQVTSIHTAYQNVRLYNAATGFNGCNSATNLVWSGLVPGAATGAGYTMVFPTGLAFSTGISICVTGAIGNTDTTSATATVMEVNVGYK